ncbi:Ig domain-containing protein [Pulveribacter sp.]|uniref:Ig domain-containing protein n=1 Tax=Pulveribacter sp. TaxID=2678893 RepID=UPI0028A65097|nr:Ig domain-containing protein [Pulveribacter sp.]
MKIFKISFLSVTAAATLIGCGGGGGSGGESRAPYNITLRAEKTLLPLNSANMQPGIGAYSPFTTLLYVHATEDGRPIPGGEEVFECNVAGGLNSGALYYVDGDDDHMTEVDDGQGGKVKVPKSFRSITLGANSGGDSFLFHAGDAKGVARITCTVTDPRDKKTVSASVEITVGSETGKAATIHAITQFPGYLGVQGNMLGLSTSVAMQADVRDDANQSVPNTGARNVQVRILPTTGAADGARLLAGSAAGSILHLSTIGGVGQFAVSSGKQSGPILLELVTDRADNDVTNGIQDAVSSLTQVYAFDQMATLPLTITGGDWGDVQNGEEFTYSLLATGGVPPYTWTVSGLPAGLTANSAGVISGTPRAPAGTYRVKATVTDKNGTRVSSDFTLKLVGEYREIQPSDFTINSCTGGVNTVCPVPNATPGLQYAYAFSASVSGVTWEFSGLPSWLQGGTTGANGYISGTPKMPDLSDPAKPDLGNCGTHQFLVTAKRGTGSVTRTASITVAGGGCP